MRRDPDQSGLGDLLEISSMDWFQEKKTRKIRKPPEFCWGKTGKTMVSWRFSLQSRNLTDYRVIFPVRNPLAGESIRIFLWGLS